MSGKVESEPTAGRMSAADVIASLGLFIASFAVYLVTLFPGLGGGGDSAKFQYVGSVLGTPHPPGYPLYVFVSFVFAKLPVGVLAWRINMMSAFLASTAVAVSFLALRRAGCRLAAAAPVSLGLAFGGLLWSKAVRAEVYSFAGALTAVIVYFAVKWGSSRRERDLYAMFAAFAVSLGNHLTVATLAPGILLYVMAVDRRAIRVRTIAVSAFGSGTTDDVLRLGRLRMDRRRTVLVHGLQSDDDQRVRGRQPGRRWCVLRRPSARDRGPGRRGGQSRGRRERFTQRRRDGEKIKFGYAALSGYEGSSRIYQTRSETRVDLGSHA